MWANGNYAQESFDDVCHSDLARCAVKRRSATLQREAIRLAQQRAFLREERFAARNEEMAIRAEEHSLETVVKRSDWWPASHLPGVGDPNARIRLRVGGQMFEIAKVVLQRDPYSLLCALCADDSPLQAHGRIATSKEGKNDAPSSNASTRMITTKYDPDTTNGLVAVVDRDWWLFRLVLIFLRDGLVPADRSTALQLYREASFWRLNTLQRAIEEAHLNVTRTEFKWNSSDGRLQESTMGDDDKFWKMKESGAWWQPSKDDTSKNQENEEPDWWKDEPSDSSSIFNQSTWGYYRR